MTVLGDHCVGDLEITSCIRSATERLEVIRRTRLEELRLVAERARERVHVRGSFPAPIIRVVRMGRDGHRSSSDSVSDEPIQLLPPATAKSPRP